jgi:hypothetical protein
MDRPAHRPRWAALARSSPGMIPGVGEPLDAPGTSRPRGGSGRQRPAPPARDV